MSHTLDIDVLIQVMSLVDHRGDLVSLIQTCHTLYDIGVPFLFRPYFHTNLKTLREFHSFASFLFTRPLRCLLVRQLAISIRDFCKVPDTVDCLVWMLDHLSFLEDLALLEGEMLLDDRCHVGPAIGRLKKLKRFTLRNPPMPDAGMLEEFLSALRSPLDSLDVCFRNYNRNDFGYPVNPIVVFKPLISHVKHLAVSYVSFFDSGIEYPGVESLSLDYCVYAATGCLVRAFPNLRKLKVSLMIPELTLGSRPVDNRRRYNLMNQMNDRWESLDELSGTVTDIYMFAIRAPVRHIDVSSLALEPGHAHQLAAIFAESHPASFKVYVHTPKFSLEKFEGILIMMKEYLERLDVTVDISDASSLPSTVIDKIAGIIAELKLSHLWLRLAWKDNRIRITRNPPLEVHPIDVELKALDRAVVARRMKESCPALQYVAVEVVGHPAKYWGAVKEGEEDNEKLVPLGIEVGESRMTWWEIPEAPIVDIDHDPAAVEV